MTPFLAATDYNYIAIAAVVGAVIGLLATGANSNKKSETRLLQLELQLKELRTRLDTLLKHQGIEIPVPPGPADISPEVQLMARDPGQKIAAIRLHREQHPGLGLLEAKTRLEHFAQTGQ
jgi:ribosomal protein L7/L12